jgi:hypothetical protein
MVMGISRALEHVPQGMPAQITSRGWAEWQSSDTICDSNVSARSMVIVGSQGLCLFRAWSTGTTEKPALFRPKLSLADPAQSSNAIGLSIEVEEDKGKFCCTDVVCERLSKGSAGTRFKGAIDEAQKFSPLVGRSNSLSVQDTAASARIGEERMTVEWQSKGNSGLMDWGKILGTVPTEESADSPACCVVASQAAWLEGLGSVLGFFAFLGQF